MMKAKTERKTSGSPSDTGKREISGMLFSDVSETAVGGGMARKIGRMQRATESKFPWPRVMNCRDQIVEGVRACEESELSILSKHN